ncbi:hypothetical protein [Wielerella bovis]|uniref:hypothetical protein n=1 Tax=Wielerella bovis TaxID=2917790 RepID=UPI002019B869|nr:hypothetical protein [Wielerella bovis]ULJ64028.1 hypothetical protein MIS33_07610 [Wielerella bovis]ULJ67510.1 hypothetical protein MIS31_02840 [Wielerella bovis]
MDNLKYLPFAQIDLQDPFFDSLKQDYVEFSQWFVKKAQAYAYVLYSAQDNSIQGFMYLKTEEKVDDVTPPILSSALKIGTFKFNPQQTLRGHRFLKKALDVAIHQNLRYVYLTVFAKHEGLIKLIETYGFYRHGEKQSDNGTEYVYVRDLSLIQGDILKDYPLVKPQSVNKYLLAIEPKYHTALIPEAILNNERLDIVKDVSHSNSIQKIYLSAAHNAPELKKGDLLLMYRKSDGTAPAAFRSVVSAVCTVLEVKNIHDFTDEKKYLDYCEKFSVFSKKELCQFYANKRYPHIIRFAFNFAFPKRPIRRQLIDDVGISTERLVLMAITDQQFNHILKLGNINENFIIHQT